MITWSGQDAPTIGLPRVSQSAPRKAESWRNLLLSKKKRRLKPGRVESLEPFHVFPAAAQECCPLCININNWKRPVKTPPKLTWGEGQGRHMQGESRRCPSVRGSGLTGGRRRCAWCTAWSHPPEHRWLCPPPPSRSHPRCPGPTLEGCSPGPAPEAAANCAAVGSRNLNERTHVKAAGDLHLRRSKEGKSGFWTAVSCEGATFLQHALTLDISCHQLDSHF